MQIRWDDKDTTVIYDLVERQFFNAANEAHRQYYFNVCPEETENGWLAEWQPRRYAVEVGLYRPGAENIFSSVVKKGKLVDDICLYYPYKGPEDPWETSTREHCIVAVKENNKVSVVLYLTAGIGRLPWEVPFRLKQLKLEIDWYLTGTEPLPAEARVEQILYIENLQDRIINKTVLITGFEGIRQLGRFYDVVTECPGCEALSCHPPSYVFTSWWQKNKCVDFIETVNSLGCLNDIKHVEALLQSKYLAYYEPFPLFTAFFQTPRWIPIWGIDSPYAVTTRRHFLEIIPNPYKNRRKLALPGWCWGVEDTCLVGLDSSFAYILVDPFNPKTKPLWGSLTAAWDEPRLYDIRIPREKWHDRLTVDDLVALLNWLSKNTGECPLL